MASVKFALIGDSHAGAIGRAARGHDKAFHGGPMASGRLFYDDFFVADGGVLRFTDTETQAMHAELCELMQMTNLAHLDVPLITTVGSGFHVPATKAMWASFQNTDGAFDDGFLQSDLCVSICDRMLAPMVSFHKFLIGRGIDVQFALPPQRVPDTSDPDVFLLIQNRAIAALNEMGCRIIDVRRDTCDDQGRQLPQYCQDNDPLHASPAMGAAVLRDVGYLM